MYSLPEVTGIIALALAEDLGVPVDTFSRPSVPTDAASGQRLLAHDVTSTAALPAGATFSGTITARQPLVVAGLPVAERVWSVLARAAGMPSVVEVFPLLAEGTKVEPGTKLAEVSGPARLVLAGERTALNFLMVLSGIATETAQWIAEAGPALAVCDTRKTFPGLRTLSKYAVRVGGGTNHRAGLWDMVLVKDNHLAASGDLTATVRAARAVHAEMTVEIEADSIEAALRAVRAGADIVLLDNMSDDQLALAVAAVRESANAAGREVLTEASGGIRFERLEGLQQTGVDRVSTSALTLAAPVDIALDED